MELIKQEIFSQGIIEKFDYKFEVKQEGLYLIEIIANCKSWKQNLKKFISFFRDDDLTVKINDIEFPKQNGKRGLFNGEVAWNGNNLKGLSKTNVFVIRLNKGEHTIHFIADQQPFLKSIKISLVETQNLASLQYMPIENNPAQDGDRRQWINIILVNLSLKNLLIKASATKREQDSDDIKLIIDGKIQKNSETKLHKYWYWCGRVLKGAEKEFNQEINLEQGLHYIEFWADRTPFLYKVEIKLGDIEAEEPSESEDEKEKVRIPTVDDPKWAGNFNDDTEQMILARTIFGEARQTEFLDKLRIAVGWSVRNRIKSPQWGDTYHKVILEDAQYSAFNKGDKNWPYVQDPLKDNKPLDKQAWENCYKIAGQVMQGEVSDPTSGANHYFSTFINPPKWTKSPQAKFKIKIDNTLFYEVDWSRKGFIKMLLIILVAIISVLLGGLYLGIKINTKNDSKEALVDTRGVESFKHLFIHPKNEEIFKILFNEKGEFLKLEQITYDNYPKTQLKVFSDSDRFGFFQELHTKEEARNINPDDSEATKEYYENHTALMISEDEYSEPHEVYRGDYHTSYWELVGYDNKHAIVYYNCGSSCLYAYEINALTGKVKSEYFKYTPLDFMEKKLREDKILN